MTPLIPTNDLVCTVASFVPFEINEFKPGLLPSRYIIPASDTKIPRVIHVGTAIHYVYLDETRGHLPVRQPSNEVARSIVQDFITSQLRVSEDCQPALFWVPGRLEPADVMLQARARVQQCLQFQNNWLISLTKLADDDWTRYQKHTAISDFQRLAAQILGLRPEEHAWMNQITTANSVPCPICHNLLSPGVAVCGNCGVVIDKKKVDQYEFVKK